ncbi:PEPxxWA-CTERM sorting domain-containing protein [Sphingomonas sp. PAMC 26621]|uniref:PEPxxWA-CTERM sorting domain-containing protein n=1 Tax=Sphingomonas sp. PAMC 26621 TaxID=1112213 RepID=UPI000289D249|nr:PEPxxWA-CTERM sorting domain-containing protein [Sphingomonas sp. PAMC 26621]
MKKILSAATVALLATAAPAFAATPINVPFTAPTGVATTEAFSGLVRVTVSGTGFSNGAAVNDAFYSVSTQNRNSGLYQLGFAANGAALKAVSNSIFGGVVPTYSANNTYSFVLNTGLSQASLLSFGVLDDQFGDNGGSYTVSVAAVPEPATWGMMLVGFGMIGFGLRSYQRKSTKVTYA